MFRHICLHTAIDSVCSQTILVKPLYIGSYFGTFLRPKYHWCKGCKTEIYIDPLIFPNDVVCYTKQKHIVELYWVVFTKSMCKNFQHEFYHPFFSWWRHHMEIFPYYWHFVVGIHHSCLINIRVGSDLRKHALHLMSLQSIKLDSICRVS